MSHHEYINTGQFCIAAQLNGIETVHLYTDPLPTPCFDELLTQVTFSARAFDPNVSIYVVPQISNDLQEWQSLTAYQFGPLVTPGTQIIKQPIVGLWQRFDCLCSHMAPGSAVAGQNVDIVTIGRGEDPPIDDFKVSYWDMVEYLNAIRLGFPAVPLPGTGRVIPFLQNETLLTSDNGSGTNRLIYSPAFPTMEFKKLFLHLHVEGFIGRALTSSLKVYFETTITWPYPEPTYSLSNIVSLTPLPNDQFLEVDTVGALSRICCVLNEPTINATQMGAHVTLTGVGRK